jgi:hypothetical protein
MAKFLFSYRMPADFAPGQSGNEEAWGAWFGELGSSILEPGNPTFERTSLGNTKEGSVLSGYTVVQADDLESATTLAKGCPVLSRGGGVEVGAITEIM